MIFTGKKKIDYTLQAHSNIKPIKWFKHQVVFAFCIKPKCVRESLDKIIRRSIKTIFFFHKQKWKLLKHNKKVHAHIQQTLGKTKNKLYCTTSSKG